MKTAEEKANELVDKFVENGLDCGIGMHRTMVRMIETAIKAQDRDTRHQCAEAVTNLIPDHVVTDDDCQHFYFISKASAHATCMNVKAC